MIKLLLAAGVLLVFLMTACAEGESPEEQLQRHYEEVIVPETEVGLIPIAQSCDIDGGPDPGACQMFGMMMGELSTVRLARYWEAMQWLGVEEPGPEILPEVVSPNDDCEYLAITVWGEYPPEGVRGMCSFFRSEQFPPCSSGGTGDPGDSIAGFERCLEELGDQFLEYSNE
jgi:hypothetical protein